MKLILLLSIFGMALVHANTPRFDNSKLFVKLKDGANLPQSELIKSGKHLFGTNYIVSTTDAQKLQAELKHNNDVVKTEKNYYAGKRELPSVSPIKFNGNEPMEVFAAFNDPKVGRVWSFADATANKKGVSVNKSYLSPLGVEKEEIIVAVVDTGVDYNHEDLKSIMWINPNEIPGNKIDDDGNGYIDDIHGINTLTKNPNSAASGNPMASHSHGTHVAGTIAAAQNNNVGIAGIASSVKILAVRAVPDSSDETDADVVASFLYAAQNGAKIINCSFGKNHNEGGMIVNETIDHIGKNHGVLVIAAAGNDYGRNIDKNKVYPASFESDYLMVVASTTKNGGMSWFSNVGAKSVDLGAPGSDIYSTVKNNRYGNMSGTSMAAPTAAGVAAEVLSHFPELTPIELKKVLMDSVTPVSKFKGKMVSPGRIDLFNSLQYTLENFSNL